MNALHLLPAPVRAALKRSLRALGSASWFRPFGMALVRGLNRRTFRILRETPGVREIYVRGSYVRGPFIPLASDIDLALVLTDAAGRSYDAVLEVHRAMARVRRTNPSLRDWWSHMIAESELPVVRALSALYGTADWRDERNRATAPHDDWSDDRLVRAADWAQLCMWSGSAFHAFLYPGGGVHDFNAGVKKSFRFAKQVGAAAGGNGGRGGSRGGGDSGIGADGIGADGDIRTDSGKLGALVRLFRAIERGAALVNDGSTGGGKDHGGGEGHGRRERHDGGFVRTERAHFLVIEDGLDDSAIEKRLIEIRAQPPPEKIVTYVVPSSAFSVWPFPAEEVEAGSPPPAMPAPRAREIYLFEAIFLPSALRLAPVFEDPEPRLRRIVSSLERENRIYGGRDDSGAGGPDDARALDARALDARALDAQALFERGADLVETLGASLLAFAQDRRRRS